MGILLNDGMVRPTFRFTRLRFAGGTPYETVMEPEQREGRQVLSSAVAGAVLPVLAGVVQSGTAIRVAGVFRLPDGKPLTVGGKTGSGDNEYKAIGRAGQVLSERPVNRTAVFVFYVGDRYFGTITAYVPGKEAENYSFTSSLPVALLKLLAPAIETRFSALRPPRSELDHPQTVSNHPSESPFAAADLAREID